MVKGVCLVKDVCGKGVRMVRGVCGKGVCVC